MVLTPRSTVLELFYWRNLKFWGRGSPSPQLCHRSSQIINTFSSSFRCRVERGLKKTQRSLSKSYIILSLRRTYHVYFHNVVCVDTKASTSQDKITLTTLSGAHYIKRISCIPHRRIQTTRANCAHFHRCRGHPRSRDRFPVPPPFPYNFDSCFKQFFLSRLSFRYLNILSYEKFSFSRAKFSRKALKRLYRTEHI